MTHISGFERSQLLLLPEAVDDYVSGENPVRFIDAFVDGLDLAYRPQSFLPRRERFFLTCVFGRVDLVGSGGFCPVSSDGTGSGSLVVG